MLACQPTAAALGATEMKLQAVMEQYRRTPSAALAAVVRDLEGDVEVAKSTAEVAAAAAAQADRLVTTSRAKAMRQALGRRDVGEVNASLRQLLTKAEAVRGQLRLYWRDGARSDWTVGSPFS
jgi:hypothetical protein